MRVFHIKSMATSSRARSSILNVQKDKNEWISMNDNALHVFDTDRAFASEEEEEEEEEDKVQGKAF